MHVMLEGATVMKAALTAALAARTSRHQPGAAGERSDGTMDEVGTSASGTTIKTAVAVVAPLQATAQIVSDCNTATDARHGNDVWRRPDTENNTTRTTKRKKMVPLG